MNSFYCIEEINALGFKSVGKNAMISRKCSIYGADSIVIGNEVRIDDFCILSGKISLGNNIHIAAYSALFGGITGIEMHDFSGLSSRVSVYAESDNYLGTHMTNPTVPYIYKDILKGKVIISKHVIVGSGSIILPNVVIGEGCAIGAMSLVQKNTNPWGIYVGIPSERIKERCRDLLLLEEEYLNNYYPSD